jgi:uncharacterized protein YndB with AHSA1/START domain
MRGEPIVVEQVLDAPVERVWRSITDKDQMCQWFFQTINAFEPRVGFETKFDVRDGDRVYPHLWKVTEVIPERKITYDWKYGGFPGQSVVVWDLSPIGKQTKLRLTQTGIETFPHSDDPAFSRESGLAGWTYFLCKSLPAYLAR